MKPFHLATALGLVAWAQLGVSPASACLSCGCGGSGASSDLGAVGGASSLFSMGHHWLVQEGVSMRNISGSFNELGTWNPIPVGGSMVSMSSTIGFTYYPSMQTSFGLQLPVVANALNGASWGPLGSINPTDLPRTVGTALGDVAFQGAYTFFEADQWALAAWGGGSVPTGNASGDPQALSGAGVFNGQVGMIGLTQVGPLEFAANFGYQRPFGTPPITTSSFYVGEAWMANLQGNVRLNDSFRVGLGWNGYIGQGRFGTNDIPVPMAKIKVVPTVQYSFNTTEGVRVALGYDPSTLGRNAMTDVTAYAIFYQYMP